MLLPDIHRGREILTWRNDVLMTRDVRPSIHDVVLVEFWPFWARRLRATLRVTFGASLNVRLASSLGGLFDEVGVSAPDIIVLGIKAETDDLARHSIQALRQFGVTTPILVVGEFRKTGRIGLGTIDGVAAIHADDVCSGSIAAAFLNARSGANNRRMVD